MESPIVASPVCDEAELAESIDDGEIVDEIDEDDPEIEAELPEILPQSQPAINPKLCEQCKENDFKYRCPRCAMKTCSLACCKQHKIDKECSGIRGDFTPVKALSQFNEVKSVEDQHFLHDVRNAVLPAKEEHAKAQIDRPKVTPDGRRYEPKSGQEKFLLQQTFHRRIFLSFTDDKGGEDNSRHEQFSDTVFWSIDIIFRKQNAENSTDDYTYRVHQVPETIRPVTVLKQFLKPRIFGPLVSKGDLDLEKLAPFIDAGLDHVNVQMKVPIGDFPNKYYPVLKDAPFIDSTRNRAIVNHPVWIVVLDNEFMDYETLTEEEMDSIREKVRNERSIMDPYHNRGGGGGRGGNFRGGFRGNSRGFRGGGGRPRFDRFERRDGDSNTDRKRFHDGHSDRRDRDFKRGRGNRRDFSRGQRQRSPSFDPFNPYEGPCALPLDD